VDHSRRRKKDNMSSIKKAVLIAAPLRMLAISANAQVNSETGGV
jgi:hypothetical protein